MFCAIFSNSSHLGIPNCKKNTTDSYKKHSGTKTDQFQPIDLKILSFSCICYFSNSPWRPSWIVNLYKYEIVPFRDYCDQNLNKIHSCFLEILAFEQNSTCKHKVGHCDLTLLCFYTPGIRSMLWGYNVFVFSVCVCVCLLTIFVSAP